VTSTAPGTDTASAATAGPDRHPLDRPAWAAMTGPHAHLAQRHGMAARYQAEVCGFSALADETDPRSWADLAELTGPGGQVMLGALAELPPAGWDLVWHGEGVQMVSTTVDSFDDSDIEQLGLSDVAEVLDLVERTRPGPFAPRTIEMGRYLGIRREGALVAMAGERLHPPGWTEISAVCTDPAYRGQGLAGRLVQAVAAGIRERNETPFLHAAASNTKAIRLYESLGFTIRRSTIFLQAQVTA
jgi:ribosomal protein S18 acetylase RimI-like enzyme